jgi:16S rRNA (cytidine1402-2'-O)-methyltransferase
MLYVVATPIGNLGDMSPRAVEVLKNVAIIACEDTRVTKKLLDHFDIQTKTTSYHAQSDDKKEDYILELLREGRDVALVSDAGTPTISDPGSRLVKRVYDELDDVQVVTIPGASAVMSALSISGIPSPQFVFLGFLPHKKGRETLFREIAESQRTIVFYESPHRIEKTLKSLAEGLGEARVVAVARELTKMYEQVVRGSAAEVLTYFQEHSDQVRGEFVVIVGA